ncbi:MAG: outer membrane lipoprotein-sorting protein [Limnobacter sp.]|nr:outer membrane lipoprotein-sorting protein [Limnobacter sp.]
MSSIQKPLLRLFKPAFSAKRLTTLALAATVFHWGALPTALAATEIDATSIMTKNFAISRVKDSVFDATFTLTSKQGDERVRKTTGATKLQPNGEDQMRVTVFMSPPDVKGTSTLVVEHLDKDDDIWIYLPALKKTRRLVSNNKKDSFLGTDFSYTDVIGYTVSDWNYNLLREEEIEGKPCYVINGTPKPTM